MAVFKCKMCGGTLELNPDRETAVCEYCGTLQTVPKADNEKKMTLFTRANRLRFDCEFDKAYGIYESIITEFPEEAEAYWGLFLCKYGIEYVDDPATGKKVPTCHRSSFNSAMEDTDFEQACEYAGTDARRIYREEAKSIEELRKKIIEVSGKEEPYDLFICYKETDENGNRTLDSVLAQDIYDALTEKGYRVFFSRITLEDKLGTEYEPYIFAALHSAKIMLAVGTNFEYYNAVWVKNEWSRYLQLIASGEKKTLIPCYKNLDAYDMPKEFARLQAQDLGKVGAMQDLLRGIEKILGTAQKQQQTANALPETDNAPLLRRAFMYLSEGSWQSADECCERALDRDPECAQAYLGKLLAELHCKTQDALDTLPKPFDNSDNYQKTFQYAQDGLKQFLTDANQTIRNNNVYSEAQNEQKKDTVPALEKAVALFSTIPGWKDADTRAAACKAEIEKKRTAAAKKRKRRIKVTVLLASVAAVIAGSVAATFLWLIPEIKLHQAMTLLDNGEYDQAYEMLEKLSKSDVIASSKYNRALELIEKKDFRSARILLQNLNYLDSAELADYCIYYSQRNNLSGIKTGDTVKFGFYEQDNDASTEEEEIEWIVLTVDGNKALLLSRYALDCKPFSTTADSVSWETCSLRTWLNDTFLSTAFGFQHQEKIIPSTLSSSGSSENNTTTDKIFLFEISEIEQYLPIKDDRVATSTAFAVAHGASEGACDYWVRTLSKVKNYVSAITTLGSISYYGHRAWNSGIAVRPAMWVTID